MEGWKGLAVESWRRRQCWMCHSGRGVLEVEGYKKGSSISGEVEG